jgi:hypothetical protein
MSKQGWTQSEDLDWQNTPDGPPPPLENGIYRAVIAKAEAEPTKDGKPAVSLQLTVTAKHGSDEKLSRKMFDKLVLTKDAAFRAKQCGKACEVELPANSGYDAVSEFAAALVGCEVWIKTKQEPYAGKINARVELYVSEEKLQEVLSGASGSESASGEAAAAPAGRRRRSAA